jgi:hypothetical protein
MGAFKNTSYNTIASEHRAVRMWHRRGLSRKLGFGKIAAPPLCDSQSRGDRSVPPHDFTGTYPPSKISDLEVPGAHARFCLPIAELPSNSKSRP